MCAIWGCSWCCFFLFCVLIMGMANSMMISSVISIMIVGSVQGVLCMVRVIHPR